MIGVIDSRMNPMTLNIEWQVLNGNWRHYQTKQNQVRFILLFSIMMSQISKCALNKNLNGQIN